MSLQGMVYQTRKCGNDIVVRLAPFETDEGEVRLVGQRRLIIENASVYPLPGDIIWGGADFAHLRRGVARPHEIDYQRKGATRLIEVPYW